MKPKQVQRHWLRHIAKERFIRHLIRNKYYVSRRNIPSHYIHAWIREESMLWRKHIDFITFIVDVSNIKYTLLEKERSK